MNKNVPPMRAAKATALLWRSLERLRRPALALLLLACGAAIAPRAQAQEASGAITGRVFNPATGEYVRNAEVRVAGTSLATATEVGGYYRLNNVPEGPVTVTVNFTGYTPVSETVNVTAGQTATRDFELTSTQQRSGDTIQLEAYVVSSEREGNAKAIQNQKRNMNITTSVASDIFGDVTDGNVGEFLKFLPGVDLDYVESETRGPRLSGMDAQYAGVSFDGIKLASADANRTGDLGRATSFEALSISSIESIEINLTSSPDQDADAPAGTIDMKTKRAFERKGRRIGYNFSVNLNSEEFHLRKTPGPGGEEEYKARPNFSLEYSDVFLNQRLGVVASINHVDSFTEQYRHNLTFNRSASATDPRPMVITSLQFKDGNKNISKDTYSLTADFRASDRLVLSSTFIYNYALGQFFNRNMNFSAASNNTNANTGRARSLGDLTTVQTNGLASNTARNARVTNGDASKETYTVTAAQRFEYKLDNWTFDGAATYSRSFNNYDAIEEGHVRSADTNAITSDWIATRPSIQSHEWTVQQLSGADWFDPDNHINPRITNEGRTARTEIYSGMLNARWVAPIRRFPVVVKFGGKWAEETRVNGNDTQFWNWSYIGPNGNTLTGFNPVTGVPIITQGGNWSNYQNRNFFSTGTPNILTVKNLAGQVMPESLPMPDPNAIARLFRDHPEYFVNIATPDNYYNAFIASRRDIVQTVSAGYAMVDLRPLPKLQIRTGMRWEGTENVAREFDPRSKAEIIAAGFPFNTSTGRATTIPGLQYQFQSQPRVNRPKSYDDYFPMISAKYDITDSLQFHFGANEAISRPPVDSLTGAWIINEDTQIVTSPNPNLLPEYSKNYVARLAYYFEPAGQLSVTVRQNNIRNLRQTRNGTPEEFGVGDDPAYIGYEFRSPFNIEDPVRFRGMDIAYSQTLSFLPDTFGTITVNASYSRTYADQRRQRISPHRVSGSLGWGYKRLRMRLGVVWHDDTPWDSVYGRYKRHTTKYDLGGEYRLNSKVSLYFQGRNIFNDSQRWYESPFIEGEAGALRILENYGANWNFGVKGIF